MEWSDERHWLSGEGKSVELGSEAHQQLGGSCLQEGSSRWCGSTGWSWFKGRWSRSGSFGGSGGVWWRRGSFGGWSRWFLGLGWLCLGFGGRRSGSSDFLRPAGRFITCVHISRGRQSHLSSLQKLFL